MRRNAELELGVPGKGRIVISVIKSISHNVIEIYSPKPGEGAVVSIFRCMVEKTRGGKIHA